MKWSRFWQRERRGRDLARELDAYLEDEIEDQIAAGKPAEEARTMAMRKLGNVTRIREQEYNATAS